MLEMGKEVVCTLDEKTKWLVIVYAGNQALTSHEVHCLSMTKRYDTLRLKIINCRKCIAVACLRGKDWRLFRGCFREIISN